MFICDNMNKKEEDVKVKCPYCGAEINTLLNIQSGNMYYEMDKSGKYENLNRFESDEDFDIYVCPECLKTITDNEKDAIAFLNGKKIKIVDE